MFKEKSKRTDQSLQAMFQKAEKAPVQFIKLEGNKKYIEAAPISEEPTITEVIPCAICDKTFLTDEEYYQHIELDHDMENEMEHEESPTELYEEEEQASNDDYYQVQIDDDELELAPVTPVKKFKKEAKTNVVNRSKGSKPKILNRGFEIESSDEADVEAEVIAEIEAEVTDNFSVEEDTQVVLLDSEGTIQRVRNNEYRLVSWF